MAEAEEVEHMVQVPDATKDSVDGSDDLKKSNDQVADYHPDDVLERIPMRFVRFTLPIGGDLYFNWFTSFFGFCILWGLSIWCMADPDGALIALKSASGNITENFTVSSPIYLCCVVINGRRHFAEHFYVLFCFIPWPPTVVLHLCQSRLYLFRPMARVPLRRRQTRKAGRGTRIQ